MPAATTHPLDLIENTALVCHPGTGVFIEILYQVAYQAFHDEQFYHFIMNSIEYN